MKKLKVMVKLNIVKELPNLSNFGGERFVKDVNTERHTVFRLIDPCQDALLH